jgi:hypothetical protein
MERWFWRDAPLYDTGVRIVVVELCKLFGANMPFISPQLNQSAEEPYSQEY